MVMSPPSRVLKSPVSNSRKFPGQYADVFGDQASTETLMGKKCTVSESNINLLFPPPSCEKSMQKFDGQFSNKKGLVGATIVFFSAGYPGKKFIFEKVFKMGVKSIIIDSPDSWASVLEDQGLVAKFIAIDMNLDPDSVFRIALEEIRQLESNDEAGPADGVCTFVELSVPLVARLTEALGLPGPKPCAVDVARDKFRTRVVLKKCGLPSIECALVKNEAQLFEAADIISFPAVLKPVSGAASLGVQKINSKDELRCVYEEVQEVLRTLVVSAGALERESRSRRVDSSGCSIIANRIIDTSIMMEEYLDGDEVDVDILLRDGKPQYAVVTDNAPTHEPYFSETWACLPSMLPKWKQDDLIRMAVDSVKAMGFIDGVFHVEGKYTSRGPRLIEVNARMGGGPVRKIHKHVFGIDLLVEQMRVALGIPSHPVISAYPKTNIAYSFVNAPCSGYVMSLEFLEPFKELPGILWVQPLVRPGEHIVGKADGMPSWLCEILVEDRISPAAAAKRVQEVDELVCHAYLKIAVKQ